MRVAAYYPWYTDDSRHVTYEKPHTPPLLGDYRSYDPGLIRLHTEMMRYAGIGAAIASWWGQDDPTHAVFQEILAIGSRPAFAWAPHYEPPLENLDRYRFDIKCLAELYRKNSMFWLHSPTDHRPVIFVWMTGSDALAEAARAGADNLFHVVTACPGGDSRYIYHPSQAISTIDKQCFSISPGFWLYSDDAPKLERNLELFKGCLEWGKATEKAGWTWQLLTTWNEWAEGTGCEPDVAHGMDYLNALHESWGKS